MRAHFAVVEGEVSGDSVLKCPWQPGINRDGLLQ